MVRTENRKTNDIGSFTKVADTSDKQEIDVQKMGEELESQIKRTLHGDEKYERLSAIKAE